MRNSLMSLVCCLALAGCGGGSGSGSTSTPAPSPTPAPAPTPSPSPSVSVTYLQSYSAILPGGAKAAGLIQATDGNYYGTEASGPNSCRPQLPIPCGSIIKVTPSGVKSVFYAFGTSSTDGYSPGAIIQGRDGALYGLTGNGGAFGGGGTLFRITLGGAFSTIYSFGSSPSDGIVPNGFIQASDGNFYGTTASGGANHCDMIPQAGSNCGTVFKITPTGVETILHSFGDSVSDGIEPQSVVTEGDDHNFYGTTSLGGANQCASTPHDCGTVYKITPTGTLTILHSFGASGGDGIAPTTVPLVNAGNGVFYGATVSGGTGRCGGFYGCGTIFKITSAGDLTILHAFSLQSRADGDGPFSLLLARDGYLYGTTISGGANQCDSCGSVFRLSMSGDLTTLYSFGPVNINPARPVSLFEGGNGVFCGRTEWGPIGSGDPLTVFKLTVN